MANQLIGKLGASNNFSEEVKSRFTNEAKFLRAVYYFNLVRYFGGVPVVLHSSESEGRSRNTLDEVYQQIVSDLKDAEHIPASITGNDGRATSGAATALLSKVYLTWAQTSTTCSMQNSSILFPPGPGDGISFQKSQLIPAEKDMMLREGIPSVV